MRRTAALGLAAAVAALAVSCGGGHQARVGRGTLGWVSGPQVFHAAAALPRDRVLLGTVRNDSFKPLSLRAEDVKVRDARGHRLPATARFTDSFAHGLYGAFQKPNPLPPAELRRLGLVVLLARGAKTPLVVAYRLRAGVKLPLRVDYGAGALTVPGST